ncbi:MAG: hypothetical protein EBR62_01720, partial [Verrucomicrobia bacterium]|nr:hypothetical protein [Verrucomicrobiota bacterium]
MTTSAGCVNRSQPNTRRSPGAKKPARGSTLKRCRLPVTAAASQPMAAS